MIAIYKKELHSYMTSMAGCVFVSFFMAIMGIYFMIYNLNYGYPYFSYVLEGMVLVALILMPVLTMRCFAEERKNRTDQMLLTSQIPLSGIVLGKYLAMVTVFAVPMILACFCPLIIKSLGTAYFLVDYSTILAFFILGCAFIAIGMFISSLTESQLIAAVGTFGILFGMYLWNILVGYLPSGAFYNLIGILMIWTMIMMVVTKATRSGKLGLILEGAGFAVAILIYILKSSLFEDLLAQVLGSLSVRDILVNFAENNLFDLKGLIMLLSIGGVFVFLTIQTLNKRRWS